MKQAGTIRCNSCGQYNGHAVNCATVSRPSNPATGPIRPKHAS